MFILFVMSTLYSTIGSLLLYYNLHIFPQLGILQHLVLTFYICYFSFIKAFSHFSLFFSKYQLNLDFSIQILLQMKPLSSKYISAISGYYSILSKEFFISLFKTADTISISAKLLVILFLLTQFHTFLLYNIPFTSLNSIDFPLTTFSFLLHFHLYLLSISGVAFLGAISLKSINLVSPVLKAKRITINPPPPIPED